MPSFSFARLPRPLIAGMLALAAVALAGVFLAMNTGGDKTNQAEDYLKEEAEAAKNETTGWTSVIQKNGVLLGKDKKGRPLWKLSADTIRARNDSQSGMPRQAEATNANAVLYNEGKPETTFRAAKVLLNYGEGKAPTRMTMKGGVTARSSADWTRPRGPVAVKAPRLEVNVDDRRIYAPEKARLEQGLAGKPPIVVVVAQKMKADAALKAMQLSGAVAATTPQGAFKATAANWNWQSGRVAANGPIVVTHEDTTLTGTSLLADTQTGKGVLKGEVKAKNAGGTASAKTLDYDWKAGEIVARGGVVLARDGATLKAASITTDDKLNRAQANGGVTLQKDDLLVKANRAQAFDKMTRAVASGDVRLTRGAMSATAARLSVFNIGGGNATRIKAEGGASFFQAPTKVSAGTVEAVGVSSKSGGAAAQKIVASGGARLESGELKVAASRVEATSVAGQRIGEVTASGNVEYSRGATRVSAARVQAFNIADKKAEKIIASGGATLRDGDLRVSASRVEASNVSQAGAARVVATGGAKARNKDGAASGERVVWQNHQIVATGAVKLEASGNILSGRELKSDDKFERATLSGNVSGKLADGGTVRAPRVSYDKKANRVVAEGGVSGRKDNLTLSADRFASSADGKNAVLTGNVVVKSDDGAVLRAPEVRYVEASRKLYASGGAYFEHPQRDSMKLRGQSVVYDLKTKEAVIKGSSGSTNAKIFEDLKF